jgi:hypothetical protein
MLSDPEFVTETVLYTTSSAPVTINTPKPITMRLRSQQKPIRGVAVDAEYSSGSVTVYSGTSAQGLGTIVAAGSCRAFGVEGSSAIYVVFGLPTIPPVPGGIRGQVRVTAYASPFVAFGVATSAPALLAIGARLEQRAHHIVNLLEQILAKIP